MDRIYFEYLTDYHKWLAVRDETFGHWFVEHRTDDSGYMSLSQRGQAWSALEAWCGEHYGPRGERWSSAQSGTFRNYICFRDQSDAMLFKVWWM